MADVPGDADENAPLAMAGSAQRAARLLQPFLASWLAPKRQSTGAFRTVHHVRAGGVARQAVGVSHTDTISTQRPPPRRWGLPTHPDLRVWARALIEAQGPCFSSAPFTSRWDAPGLRAEGGGGRKEGTWRVESLLFVYQDARLGWFPPWVGNSPGVKIGGDGYHISRFFQCYSLYMPDRRGRVQVA
jgi:hypothetical protein